MNKSNLGAFRAFLIGTVAIMSTSAIAAAQNTAELSLQPQPMADALRSVAQKTGENILFTPESVAGLSAPRVSGKMSAAQAVGALTKDTNLEVVADGSDGLIVRRPSRQVVTQVPQAAEGGRQAENVEQVTVTGSRVISDIANSPTPLTVVTADQLKATTPTNIPDALNKLPVFLGSQSSRSPDNASTNAVGNVLNLRRFGVQRTLVLLDGHRIAPTNANGTVDVDTLPQMLMSRVDVVTGGASAVYGSDAVTGVVNFVLDKNFTGFKYEANAGTSNKTQGTQYEMGMAAGTDLFGGRGHLEGSLRYFHQDMVLNTALPYFNNGMNPTQVGLGTAAAPYTRIPYGRTVNQPFNPLIACGGCSVDGQSFAQNGAIGPYDPGTPTTTGNTNNGGQGGYNIYGTYQTALRTAESFGRFSYDLDNSTTAYVQTIASESATHADWWQISLSPGAGRPNTFYVNNPFLNPTEQGQLAAGNPGCPGGVASNAPSCTFSATSWIIGADGGGPGSAGTNGDIYYTNTVNRYLSVVAGIDGTLMDKYNWSVNYSHGESRQETSDPTNTNNQKLYAAQDAVLVNGNPVCYVSTTANASLYPGCVPQNPFGPSSMTSAQFRYFSANTQYVMTNIMDNIGASISGELFDLPAGPVKAALSGESRWLDYTVVSNSDPTATVNCTGLRLCSTSAPLWSQNVVANAHASENVYEFATEANIPLLKDLPLVQSLAVDVAGRFTNYSPSGSVETWKIGTDYHVNDSIRFRGTMSVDIRAPTLNDLYSPLQSTVSGFTDLLTNTSHDVQVHAQGNPNLVPEVAHTYTIGTVLTPDFIPNLTVSLDYYKINLSGAITSISYATTSIQQLCIGSGGSSPYCTLVNRNGPPTNPASGFPNFISSQSLNSATQKTEGLDFEADYNFDMADVVSWIPGSVSFRGLLSLQPYLTNVNYTNAAPIATGGPKGRITSFLTYNLDDWSVSLQDTWLSSWTQVTIPGQVYVNPRIDSWNSLDATVTRKLTFDKSSMDVYLSVQNVGGAIYPLSPSCCGYRFGNALGRFFTVGVRGAL